MFTGQIHLFAYSEADYTAKASLLYSRAAQKGTYYLCKKCTFLALVSIKALDPTSAVTVEMLKFWERWCDPKYRRETVLVEIDNQPGALGCYGEWLWWYEPGRYLVELDIHPAFSHHRQVHNGVVQYGRDLCRT